MTEFFAGAFFGVIVWNLIFNNWEKEQEKNKWIEEEPGRKYRRYS